MKNVKTLIINEKEKKLHWMVVENKNFFIFIFISLNGGGDEILGESLSEASRGKDWFSESFDIWTQSSVQSDIQTFTF